MMTVTNVELWAIGTVSDFLAAYGWYVLGAGIAGLILWKNWLQPAFSAWKEAREDAAYHKDPDKVLARMEAIQRAREAQQNVLLYNSERALQEQKEREERRRLEKAERAKRYLAVDDGQRKSEPGNGYLPLSGGGSRSTYKAPKRSACSGGGCGR